jgi:hypothetical protein
VIRAEVGVGCVVLFADLAPGSRAYVDRDWLPAGSGAVPGIVAGANGLIAWCDGPPAEGWEDAEPGAAAALALLAVSQEAAAAVDGLAPVEVTGVGLVARRVRALLKGHVGREDAERPEAIVDTTGNPATILDATRRVADLGTVVLAGESLGRPTELDIYPDVHVRGLTLAGVAPPLHRSRTSATESDDSSLVAWCRESLGEVSSGSVVPESAAWYCVTA